MLGVSGTPVLDAVGKLRDLGDHPNDKHMLSVSDSWTDDPAGRAVGRMRFVTGIQGRRLRASSLATDWSKFWEPAH